MIFIKVSQKVLKRHGSSFIVKPPNKHQHNPISNSTVWHENEFAHPSPPTQHKLSPSKHFIAIMAAKANPLKCSAKVGLFSYFHQNEGCYTKTNSIKIQIYWPLFEKMSADTKRLCQVNKQPPLIQPGDTELSGIPLDLGEWHFFIHFFYNELS